MSLPIIIVSVVFHPIGLPQPRASTLFGSALLPDRHSIAYNAIAVMLCLDINDSFEQYDNTRIDQTNLTHKRVRAPRLEQGHWDLSSVCAVAHSFDSEINQDNKCIGKLHA